MTTIKVSASVQVAPSAPATGLAAAIEVEAYTKIEFVLTDQTKDKALNLGILGTDVLFVLIKADLNDSDAAVKPKLIYKAKDREFTLDAPHLYMGPGFVQSLAAADIDFTNLTFTFAPLTPEQVKQAQGEKKTVEDAKSVKVEILVGGPAKKP